MRDLQDLDWPDRLTTTVRALDLPPERVTFELTESQNYQDLANALEILTRLRLRGFGLSLDDFGTGFSSLQKLASLPFTELKKEALCKYDEHQDSVSAEVSAYSEVRPGIRRVVRIDSNERHPRGRAVPSASPRGDSRGSHLRCAPANPL